MHRGTCFLSIAMLAAIQAAFAAEPTSFKTVNVNGVRLNYVDGGAGAPVVFVHGALSDLRIWEPLLAEDADHYHHIAYTQRYFGTNSWPDDGSGFSAAGHAADLADLIQALDLGTVHLVGWSYGGLVATLAALDHPELVHGLVLYEPGIRSLIAEGPDGPAILAERARIFGPAMESARAEDPVQAARLMIEGLLGLPAGGFDQQPEALRTVVLDNARTVPLFFAAPEPPPITCGTLTALRQPVLVVYGENTSSYYSEISRNMAECVPDGQLMIMPGVTHDGPLRDPAAFRAALDDFLAHR